MGSSEKKMLLVVLGICFLLLVWLMISLIKHHGAGVKKGRKPTREELLGYDSSSVSNAAITCAVGSLICGIMVAMTPFRRRR